MRKEYDIREFAWVQCKTGRSEKVEPALEDTVYPMELSTSPTLTTTICSMRNDLEVTFTVPDDEQAAETRTIEK
ncbi:uncharacterized protein PG998_004848 [Apiospora kogelbergensis]|uniref:Uncharacterized protein n=1 Tax=Apiospora kogelbergensis TaxID=1337665 RepID=A0AAW0Q7H4_9PEZI